MELTPVSVPLRGLGRWKASSSFFHWTTAILSFSPLAGIRSVESKDYPDLVDKYKRCFSPLAGIRSVESAGACVGGGLIAVSVPLRGLGRWKVLYHRLYNPRLQRFSPLAGIRSVESKKHTPSEIDKFVMFQSPCGD